MAKEGKEWGTPAKRTSEFLQKLDGTENNVAVRKSPGHRKGKRASRNPRRDARFRRQKGRVCKGFPGRGQLGAEVPVLCARASGVGAGPGRGRVSAGWAVGRGQCAGPGPAAMNLERLRKRVRQYLDQVGPSGDAGGALETRVLAARGPAALGFGASRTLEQASSASVAGRPGSAGPRASPRAASRAGVGASQSGPKCSAHASF